MAMKTISCLNMLNTLCMEAVTVKQYTVVVVNVKRLSSGTNLATINIPSAP